MARAPWLPRRPGRFEIAAGALTLLAAVVAFHHLGAHSITSDESASVFNARLPFPVLWQVITGGDPNMGLYYLLLHLWFGAFAQTQTETAIRTLSVVPTVLAVPVLIALATRLFDRRTGLIAGLLLALNPFFIHYAQTARSYGLVVLLVTVSSYFFVAELERPSLTNRIGYVLASSLAVYSHYFAVLVLLVQLLTLLAIRRRAAFTRGWVVVAASVVVLCAPEVVFARRAGTGPISWIQAPRLHDLLHLPTDFAGGSALLGWAFIGLGCYAVVRSLGEPVRWPAGFVAAWFALPVLVAYAFSQIKPVFLSYYLIVTLPAFVLLAAAGLARLPSRVATGAVLVLLVVCSASRLSHWYTTPGVEDYRGAAHYVMDNARPGDALAYFPSWVANGISFYERLSAGPQPLPIGFQPGAVPDSHPPRLWIVMRTPETSPQQQSQINGGLAPGYQRIGGQPQFSRILVRLYEARTGVARR